LRWGTGTARDVFAAAAHGDPRAAELLDDQARALAAGIRAVRALLDPELIVLGGGIGMRRGVVERVRTALEPGAPIEVSALGEDAGLIGALLAAPQ
jgi:predicted NBD/HSP70 family sugar kinase